MYHGWEPVYRDSPIGHCVHQEAEAEAEAQAGGAMKLKPLYTLGPTLPEFELNVFIGNSPYTHRQVWKKCIFSWEDRTTFPTISYVFLYLKIQNFPPNGHISLEGASCFPHFFPRICHQTGLQGAADHRQHDT